MIGVTYILAQGYDLKQLFIGSEGTLGVISACTLACPTAPTSTQVAFLGLSSFDAVLTAYSMARRHLSEVLSACEFLDHESYSLVTRHGAARPFETACSHYMLIEVAGSHAPHDEEKLNNYLQALMSEGVVADGTIAQAQTQAAALWRVREGITEALGKSGAVYKYDLSMPLASMYELVEVMRERVGWLGGRVSGFGHLGDGNLHLNVYTPGVFHELDGVKQAIEPFVYDWIKDRKGSVSAEHGIGVMKVPYLHKSKSQPMIGLMQSVKKLLDPNGILNPHKVLPFGIDSGSEKLNHELSQNDGKT